MTLDEAIKHCEEKAVGCDECAKEHAQLAGWLKELRQLRNTQEPVESTINDLISRATAIAEIDEYINEYSELDPKTGYHNLKWCAMKEAKDVLLTLPTVNATSVMHERYSPEKVLRNLCILRTLTNPEYSDGLSIEDCKKAFKWIEDACKLIDALWRDIDEVRPCFACKNNCKCDPYGDGFDLPFWAKCGGSCKKNWEWRGDNNG